MGYFSAFQNIPNHVGCLQDEREASRGSRWVPNTNFSPHQELQSPKEEDLTFLARLGSAMGQSRLKKKKIFMAVSGIRPLSPHFCTAALPTHLLPCTLLGSEGTNLATVTETTAK